ncbi:MAG: PIG-L family deacetylase [Pyrinomonadaceae bacterium]
MNHRKPFIEKISLRHAARKLFALLLATMLASVSLVRSQPASSLIEHEEPAEVALYQSLLDLNNPWTVMCVAAHPDDEDGATLTVLRRKYGAHTISLFSTFGEGGQNAIGPELYEELGAIRARETLAAAEIQGSEPHFLGLQDFGFSKSATEAFRVWGHNEALSRMVREIRRLRPDVVITNHDTVSGHGHHQATGRLVLEAFDAAADPARFPEQLSREGLSVWQVKRVFVRLNYEGSAGSKAIEDEAVRKGAIVSIDRSERDPVRNMTYAEQALQALRQHASQGPWPQTVPHGWASVIRYRLAREAKDAQPLPSQPQTFLDGLRLSQKLEETLTPLAVKALLPLYSSEHNRAQILAALLSLKKSGLFDAPKDMDESWRFQMMRRTLWSALAVASGAEVTIKPLDGAMLIPGSYMTFHVTLTNNSDARVQVKRAAFLDGERELSAQETSGPVEREHPLVFTEEYVAPTDAPINVPHAAHLYDGRLFGKQLGARVDVEIDGTSFPVSASIRLDVAPPVEIESVTPSTLVLTPATAAQDSKFTLRLVNHLHAPFAGQIVTGSLLDHTMINAPAFKLAANGELEKVVTLRLRSIFEAKGSSAQSPSDYVPFVIKSVQTGSRVDSLAVRAVYADAHVAPHLRVGYVRSYDDTLPDALSALGVEAKELTIDDVRAGDLQKYDTIIIDNRGYQAHTELIAANSRLLDYARGGGTLIVFYHKTSEWNPDPQKNRAQLAPYPIVLGNSRVTEENTPVAFTEAQHALLNFPNKISAADFEGWIQERGLYYPQQWDEHFAAPLAMSDAGEQPLRGGLLAADYGRGRYIYTSIVWYRQLRAGNAGAYRIFANMISYGHER